MRSLLSLSLALLSLALGAAPATAQEAKPAAPGTLTLARRPLPVGWAVEKETEMLTTLAVVVRSGDQVVQEADQRDANRESYRYQVLAADEDGTPRQVRATFGKLVQSRAINEHEREQTNVLSGRTFVIGRENGELVVTSPDEPVVKPAMVQLVRRKITGRARDQVELVGRFHEVIPTGPMAIGTTIDIPPDDAAAIMGTPKTYRVKDARLTLQGARERGGVHLAVFRITTTIEGRTASGEPDLVQTMSGDIEVGRDTLWLHAMNVTGDIRIHAVGTLADGTTTVSRGAGTVSFAGRARFAPVAAEPR